MVHEFHIGGTEAGLTINMSKTKFMRNEFAGGHPVPFLGAPLDEAEDYVYLGRLLNMKNGLRPEISRGKRAAWAAYNSARGMVESCSDYELKLISSTPQFFVCYVTLAKHGT
ncbi:unnamed protein product [Heligmosomoides polygyrus]|uniref:Reverse transcriptase n=1 Tax=Heligmosomoides polygyrus TaxID=6339 RepID=A0A183FWE8_HELPZ|nr:unnamed protein product [Heligmosomoides polygyrus]